MSLLFTDAGAQIVDCGSAASLDDLTTATALYLVYCTNAAPTTVRPLAAKVGPDYFIPYILGSGGSNRWQIEIQRATTFLIASATQANMSTFGENKWCFIGCSYNTAGANGDQHLYHGDLITGVAEAAAYTTQTVGSGSVNSNAAANLVLGNINAANRGWPGRIALAMIFNRQLSLGEINNQQFNPHVDSGCVLYIHFGRNSTGTQFDYSGNGNHGTVTGATVAENPPRVPWRYWQGHNFSPAAAGVGDGLIPGRLQPMGIIW